MSAEVIPFPKKSRNKLVDFAVFEAIIKDLGYSIILEYDFTKRDGYIKKAKFYRGGLHIPRYIYDFSLFAKYDALKECLEKYRGWVFDGDYPVIF